MGAWHVPLLHAPTEQQDRARHALRASLDRRDLRAPRPKIGPVRATWDDRVRAHARAEVISRTRAEVIAHAAVISDASEITAVSARAWRAVIRGSVQLAVRAFSASADAALAELDGHASARGIGQRAPAIPPAFHAKRTRRGGRAGRKHAQ